MDIIDFAAQLNDLIEENRDLRYQNALLIDKVEKYEQHVKDELKFHQKTVCSIFTALLEKPKNNP